MSKDTLEIVAEEALALTEQGQLKWVRTPRKSEFLSKPFTPNAGLGSISLLIGAAVAAKSIQNALDSSKDSNFTKMARIVQGETGGSSRSAATKVLSCMGIAAFMGPITCTILNAFGNDIGNTSKTDKDKGYKVLDDLLDKISECEKSVK